MALTAWADVSRRLPNPRVPIRPSAAGADAPQEPWTSRTPVRRTTSATLWAVTPEPAITTIRFPAWTTSSAMRAAPSGAVRAPPEVKTRSKPRAIAVSRAASRTGRKIEGAVQRPAHAGGVRQEAGEEVAVQLARTVAGAQDHARKAGRARGVDVMAHRVRLCRSEHEIAGARPDHGPGRTPGGAGHQSGRGREAPQFQGGAELDPIRAGRQGDLQAVRGVDADFQPARLDHRSLQ